MRVMRLSPLSLTVLLTLAGCANSRVSFSGEPKYGKTAADDLKAGEEEIKSHDFDLAVKFLDHVKNRYPFSKEAIVAELMAADARFEQGHYLEAADAYANFAKLHPNHEKVDYAEFRCGYCYYKDAPGELFILPPSYERDLKQLRQAVTKLEEFRTKRPTSSYLPEAEKALAEARSRLADHDWYVANFYAKRKHWAGAAGRLEGLIKDYPGSHYETEALLTLAQVYIQMNERFRAQQTLQQLIVKHPDDSRRPEAEKLLASIR